MTGWTFLSCSLSTASVSAIIDPGKWFHTFMTVCSKIAAPMPALNAADASGAFVDRITFTALLA